MEDLCHGLGWHNELAGVRLCTLAYREKRSPPEVGSSPTDSTRRLLSLNSVFALRRNRNNIGFHDERSLFAEPARALS